VSTHWTLRQRAMLAAMGLQPWGPPDAPTAPGPDAPRAPPARQATAGQALGREVATGIAPQRRSAPGAAMERATAPGAALERATAPSPALERGSAPQPPLTTAAAAPARPRVPVVAREPAAAPYAAGPRPVAPDPKTLAPSANGAPRPDIATLDWPALQQAVAACQACGLCATRRQTVFGAGSRSAQWLVVGEAPGEQEDATGEPFVGAAGQLLDAMLDALSLSRADPDALPAAQRESIGNALPAAQRESIANALPAAQRVFIANTLKCRPPGNRNPAADELAQCEPFLQRQIALLRPRIILAMGRFAVQALLRSDQPLGRLRGRVHAYEGVPLVVTFHPAYLLRSPSEKAKAWADLCLAAEVAEAAAAQAPA
jgi:DNA polymerase